jgi:OmcA/MtrC family decaheme c-type cytochrome
MKPWQREIVALGVAGALAFAGSLGVSACKKSGTSIAFVTSSGTPTPPTLDPAQDLPGIVIKITSVLGATGSNGSFQPGDTPLVTFALTKNDGSQLNLNDLDGGTFLFSGPTFNYQRIFPDDKDTFDVEDVKSNAVGNPDGSYSYLFAKPIPTSYPAPLHDTTKFTDGELTGQPLLAGTYTIGFAAWKDYFVEGVKYRDIGNKTFDVTFLGASTLDSREVVRIESCNRCHTKRQRHDRFNDTKMCILCHTSGAEDSGSTDTGDPTNVTIDFRVMIHKIHNGAHLPSVLGVGTKSDGTRDYTVTPVPYVVDTNDFSDHVFPAGPSMTTAMPRNKGYSLLTAAQKAQDDAIRQGVVACERCHGNPGGGLPTPAQGEIVFLQPNRRACGSCHDDIDWTKPYVKNTQNGMPPQLDDSKCKQCHAETGIDPDSGALGIRDAHLHPMLDPTVDPGIVLTTTNVSGGSGTNGNFLPGDVPAVDFTCKDGSGNDVPLSNLDSTSMTVVGPTNNRQATMIYPTPNGVTISAFDGTGRFAGASSSGKGSMSRVGGPNTTDTLIVQFTSSTVFNVSGLSSGLNGTGTLPATPSTNPSGSSLSTIAVVGTAASEAITVTFRDAQTFDVSGAVSGSLGSATLPATTSTSIRFTATDGRIAFNVAVGATPFVAGNQLFLALFSGNGAFAIVAGRTSFAVNDRFYYEVVAPASTYHQNVPMDVPLELVGIGNGTVGQTFTPANQPVYYGRQTLFEATAAVGIVSSLSTSTVPYARAVTVNVLPPVAPNDFAMIDSGTATAEVAQVGFVDPTLKKVFFRTPLRFAHAATAPLQKNTLTFRQEGVQYTLVNGTVTLAGSSVKPWVMTYRTDGRFGWQRAPGDPLQATYPPPMNDSADIGEEWGEWTGKSFVDGTYTVSFWGYISRNVVRNGELQTYRGTSPATTMDFLFGGASAITPYSIIPPTGETCAACHDELWFHGGTRRGVAACLTCHAIAGAEDWAQYSARSNGTVASPTTGVTINFRTMLHKIHRGSDLVQKYIIEGNGGPSEFEEIAFPAAPEGVKQCVACHGQGSTSWIQPSDRSHPTQQVIPFRGWQPVCTSCHDSPNTQAHATLMTANGVESCLTCHGPGAEHSVEKRHKTYGGG